MPNSEMRLKLGGYRLTTAEIIYHLPDYPALLQTFVWQQLDLAPHFPRLQLFIDFWRRNLEAQLHSVRVANATFMDAGQLHHADSEYLLH